MKQKGWEVKGIEPDEGARAKAKNLFQLVLDDTDSLETLIGGQFDAISLWHVLEHVHQLHDYIEKLKELLKRNGKIFIAVPNYRSLDAGIYRPYWAAYDVPRHLYHFSPRSMEALMERHGLKIVEKKPMWYDSFYISFLSSKYYKGRTEWITAAFAGLRSNIRALMNKDKCSSVIYIIEQPQG
jgi:2-polyprenyl-3-methyl-5-hydroxy-6-metoxy-1,4-benzoquinol methylase